MRDLPGGASVGSGRDGMLPLNHRTIFATDNYSSNLPTHVVYSYIFANHKAYKATDRRAYFQAYFTSYVFTNDANPKRGTHNCT